VTPIRALREAEGKLRRAVRQGGGAETGRLLLDWRRRLDDALTALPLADPRASALLSDAETLVRWARQALRINRAHLSARAARLAPNALRYGSLPAPVRHTWELDA